MPRSGRGLFVALVLVAPLGGCVIPIPLGAIIVDGARWRGECVCERCLMYDADLNCIETEILTVRDVFTCDADPDYANEFPIEDTLRENCREDVISGVTCELREIDPDDMVGSRFVVVEAEGSCPSVTIDCDDTTACKTAGTSVVTVKHSESILSVDSPEGSGSTHLSGNVGIDIGACATNALGSRECPLTVRWLDLDGDDFTIGGAGLSATYALASAAGYGRYFPDLAIFTIDVGTMEIIASASTSDGRKAVQATNSFLGVGFLVPESGAFLLQQDFDVEDISLHLQVVGEVANIMPTVTLPTRTEECNQAGGAHTVLIADADDFDGTIAAVDWFIDGAFVTHGGESLELDLALGTHTVEALVVDDEGGYASARATVTVEDTLPPEFGAAPLCVWPPNHDEIVVSTSDLSEFITDICDPMVEVAFTAASSSEPDDATGDGHTTGDVSATSDVICVRSERSGQSDEGRTYTVGVTLTDDAGHEATTDLLIEVGHDQGHAKCERRIRPETTVSADDPRCVPEADSLLSLVASAEEESAGCRIAFGPKRSGSLVAGGALVIGLILLRRRRRRPEDAC